MLTMARDQDAMLTSALSLGMPPEEEGPAV